MYYTSLLSIVYWISPVIPTETPLYTKDPKADLETALGSLH